MTPEARTEREVNNNVVGAEHGRDVALRVREVCERRPLRSQNQHDRCAR